MSNKDIKNKDAIKNRNKGLFIAIAAIFSLIILMTYKIPLFENELNGTVIGFSELHTKSELKLFATVRLNNGVQVLATMPPDLQKQYDSKVMLTEGVAMFGRKTYKVISYTE